MSHAFGGLFHDISVATRSLLRDRRFTVAAIVVLGLAIGVNQSVFALINAALIRDLPFEHSDRLVSVGISDGRGLGALSIPDYVDWRDGATVFEHGLGAAMSTLMNVSETGRFPEQYRGAYVSANAFRILRARPSIGRGFTLDDDRAGAAPVVVIGHGLWQRRYDRDPGVIGRTVRINDLLATIVGVMPPGFSFPFANDLWQPLALAPAAMKPRRSAPAVQVFGRLSEGAEIGRAQSELQAVAGRLAREFPGSNPQTRAFVVSMREEYSVRSPLFGPFIAAVFIVMLVACANLANLLLSRAVSRRRELALRFSLGASRWRLVRYQLVECALIALVAALLGAWLSGYGANAIAAAFVPLEPGGATTRPFWLNLSLDGASVLFIGVLCLAATLACGLLPALHIFRVDANAVLKDSVGGGLRTRRWADAVVVLEIAMTLALTASAGLLWRSFIDRYQRERVIDTENLATMWLGLPDQKYQTPESRSRFFEQLQERLAARPAIGSASLASSAPLEVADGVREVVLDTGAGSASSGIAAVVQTGPAYVETTGLPIRQGRAFVEGDRVAGSEGAIVDERFVARFFPSSDPIGRRIRLEPPAQRSLQTPPVTPWMTVVGVAASLPHFGTRETLRPLVYVPIGATVPLEGPATIIVRGTDTRAAIQAVREEVRALDGDLVVSGIEPVEGLLARMRHRVRLVGTWFGVIAVIALVLVSVALYALVAHSVVLRRQEIGVRMALGARADQVLWLFARGAALRIAVGVVLGLAGAAAMGRLLSSHLDAITPTDPLTLGSVAMLLSLVSIGSSVLPARRAARLDPTEALRGD